MMSKDVKTAEYTLLFGNCLERMKEIPDGSVDLILTDPPYVRMVSEKWDNLSDNEASDFYNKVFSEIGRILRHGGRRLMFGSNDTLKYYYENSQLLHREILVVEKDVKKVSAGRNTKQYKQHVNHVEYVFVATKYAREYVKDLLLTSKSSTNLSAKDINDELGVKSNGGGMWSIYTGNNKCGQVPTKLQWDKFRAIFKSLPDYKSFEEVFNNSLSMGNVLKGFNFITKPRLHPTQKPVDLLEYLINTYSNEGDTVLDFTFGSCSTGVAALNTNRKFIGIEMEEKYFDIGASRMESV
jgi:site-specific DNA-methyltransferase (adenine-specific)